MIRTGTGACSSERTPTADDDGMAGVDSRVSMPEPSELFFISDHWARL